jgi:ribosomal protein L11 methylase PrmA
MVQEENPCDFRSELFQSFEIREEWREEVHERGACRAAVPADAEVKRVLLQPSTAWGDGGHPTTRMIVGWLNSSDLRGMSVLDYGHAPLPC